MKLRLSDADVVLMISDIVQAIDYDIWKEIYVQGGGDPSDQEEIQNKLYRIVKEYCEQNFS